MIEPISRAELLGFTSQLVGAYTSNHAVSSKDLSAVIAQVYQSLSDISKNPHSLRNRSSKSPAVPIEDSVQEYYIVCLEDGKKLQMLKRHLSTVYKMSLDHYKDRWGLPLDYPVVCPNYTKRRSQIAKATHFGSKGRPRKNPKIGAEQSQEAEATNLLMHSKISLHTG